MKYKIGGSLGFILIVLFQVALFGAVVFGVVKITEEINDHGLKNIVERIWEGPND